MRIFFVCILLFLAVMSGGCENNEFTDPRGADQCLRAELFEKCMKLLPAGPVSTHYSDWDEVVDSCESSAYYQSLRLKSQVKPECW